MSDAGEAPAREPVPMAGAGSTLAATSEPATATSPTAITGAAPGRSPFRPRTFLDARAEPQADGSPDAPEAEPERAPQPPAAAAPSAQIAPAPERAAPSGAAAEAGSEAATVDGLGRTTSASEAMASAPPGAFEAEATSSLAPLPESDGVSAAPPAREPGHGTEPAAAVAEPPTAAPSAAAPSATEPPTAVPFATAPSATAPPSYASQPPLQPPPVAPRPSTPPAHLTAAPPAHLTAAPPPSEQARSELRRRRDTLAEEVTELHWDLGGLAYEMAIRDHFRLDVLVRRAAVLQERDAELAELERLLQMEEGGIAGSCPTCGAPHSRGAVYCWQCGTALMQRSQSSMLPESDGATAVMDGLRPPGRPGADNSSDG